MNQCGSPDMQHASPVCGVARIEVIPEDHLISARVDPLTLKGAGASAYRCRAGHVFLLLAEDSSLEAPVRERNGYSIVL